MALVALILSLLIAAFGALGVVSPARFIAVVRSFETPAGLYVAAAIRVVLGISLYLSAPASRAPDLMRVLGIIITVVGIATPLLGRSRRATRLLSGPGLRVRGWAGLAVVLGLLLAFSVYS
jgi:hypothetical protein